MSKLKHTALLLVFLASPALAANAPPTEASIKQLLAVTESRKLADGVMKQMDGMMKNGVQQALQGRPVTPKQQEIIDGMERKTIALLKQDLDWDSLEPVYIRIYRESFTQEEINGMLDFYKTPSGRALIRKMPVVMQKTMVEMQARMMPLMQKLQKIEQETIAELRAQ